MKSSTSSSLILFTFLIFLVSGCAEKKIRTLSESETPREQSIAYSMDPEKNSSVFLDKTEELGLLGVQAVHLYAVDVNNDGFTDLITLEDFYSSPKFYLFDKINKKFKITENPFGEIVRASYLNFIDLDRDKIYDVIVGNLNQKSEMTQYPARIYRGSLENGKIKYTQKASVPTGVLPTGSIAPLDFNLDGELDLYLANWFSQKDDNPRPVPDSLLQGKGFVFTDTGSFLKGEYDFNKTSKNYPNAVPSFGASVCDVDKNGFPDVITSSSNGYHNKLWLNIDGKSFVNYAAESGYGADDEGSAESKGGGNSFFSLCGDYNNDEIVDIVVGNLARESDPDSRDKSSILTGRVKTFPPKFYRSDFYLASTLPNWSEGNRRGVWIDYNLDGLDDLLIANSGFPPSSRLILFEQESDHAFEDRAAELGINLVNPSGIVTIDLNNDGIMDFISGQSKVRAGDVDTRIYAYVNQTERLGKGSLRFHLQGKKSNYHGISSTVVMKTDKKSKRFASVVYTTGSLPSQNEEGVYFAFNYEVPLEVEVRWSFGVKDRLGRITPMIKKYNLINTKLKGKHTELNLCDDGRVLPRSKTCY